MGIKRRIRQFARRVAGLPTQPAPGQMRLAAPLLAPHSDFGKTASPDDYISFESVFYNPDAVIAQMREYLPVIESVQHLGQLVDIGVGRGEFLRLLRDTGVSATGCEINAAEFGILRQQGLPVALADGLQYLDGFEDGSLAGVTAIQVVEHLQPGYLERLLARIGDKLASGGLVLLETPNMLNWMVQRDFWLDSSHVRPYPPQLLQYHLQRAGLHAFELWYSNPTTGGGPGSLEPERDFGTVALLGWK